MLTVQDYFFLWLTDSKLPLSSRNDVILLNINTMRECHIPIGKRVLMTSVKKSQKVND